MVIAASSGETTNEECSGRIVVDESDYRFDDEKLPFEIKEVIHIRKNEKFSKYYECFDEIGEGKFGKVYRCREKATGLELAAKRIKIKRDADRAQVEKEVAIMTQMRHPRIAQIYDAFATPENDIILIMEVVQGGELFDRVVDENYVLTELAVVMIICQLCEAVAYIHSKNIVHLDIKPENIMCVSQSGNRIKLIDFGLAQYYDGSSNLLFMAGTPEFVAPEVIKFEPIDFHTDMWSIGVITYILLSGISPFLGDTPGDTYCAVEKGEWDFDDEAFEGISDAAKDFISKLLVYDQKKRMLPEECLIHEWILGSRAKAANDHILNQPNIGKPISKEGLKSYLKNKRFRKVTWAIVFVVRFKKFGSLNYKFFDEVCSVSSHDVPHDATDSLKLPSSEEDSGAWPPPQTSESVSGDVAIAGSSTDNGRESACSVKQMTETAPSKENSSAKLLNGDSKAVCMETRELALTIGNTASGKLLNSVVKEKKIKEEKVNTTKNTTVVAKAASVDAINGEKTVEVKEGKTQRSSTANRENLSGKAGEHSCKGSAVSAILSMFSQKAEAAKRTERRPPRAVRTLRDVERPPRNVSAAAAEDGCGTTLAAKSPLTIRRSSLQTASNSVHIPTDKNNGGSSSLQASTSFVTDVVKRNSVSASAVKTTHDVETSRADPSQAKAKQVAESTDVSQAKGKQIAGNIGVSQVKAKQVAESTDVSQTKEKHTAESTDVSQAKGKQVAGSTDVSQPKTKQVAGSTDVSLAKVKQAAESADVSPAKARQRAESTNVSQGKAKEAAESTDVSQAKAKQVTESSDVLQAKTAKAKYAPGSADASQAKGKQVSESTDASQAKTKRIVGDGGVSEVKTMEIVECTDPKGSLSIVQSSESQGLPKKAREKKLREQLNVENTSDERTIRNLLASNEKPYEAESSPSENLHNTASVKTKTRIKIENKISERSITKITNGQVIQESNKTGTNEVKVDVTESNLRPASVTVEGGMKFKGQRQSRIAQFHSVALQAETQKKIISQNSANGPTVVKIDKTENMQKGRVRVGGQLKDTDGLLLSKKTVSVLNELANQKIAKSISQPSKTDAPAAERRTESVREKNVVSVESRSTENGVTHVEELTKKNIVTRSASAEKPPSGRSTGEKKRTVTKKKERDKENSVSDGEKGNGSPGSSSPAARKKAQKSEFGSLDSLTSSASEKDNYVTAQVRTAVRPNKSDGRESKKSDMKLRDDNKMKTALLDRENELQESLPTENWHRSRLKGLLTQAVRRDLNLNSSGRKEQEKGDASKRESWRVENEDLLSKSLSYGTATTSKVDKEEINNSKTAMSSSYMTRKPPIGEKFTPRNGGFSREQLHERSTNYKVLDPPGFALSRNQSESNIAARARASAVNWVQLRRQTIEEDTGIKDSQQLEVLQGASAEQEKADEAEVNSFGWLKMQLQSRIVDAEKGEQASKVRSAQVKMPFNSAKQALLMWQSMDKNSAVPGKPT